jgi:hypothetical protein
VKGWALTGLVTILVTAPTLAADDDTVRKDLTATIALQGLSCGEVVSAVRRGENDYLATCKDGTRYRVFVNAQGRVIVQKQ